MPAGWLQLPSGPRWLRLLGVVLCAAAAALLLIFAVPIGRDRPCASQGMHWTASPSSNDSSSSSSSSSSSKAGAEQQKQLGLGASAGLWVLPAVPECKSIEGSSELCKWCMATFSALQRHPLHDRFAASYLPGSPCAMPPDLLGKLRRGDRVTINVVGGSMTYGHRCDDGRTNETHCAWPARMQARLSQLFPGADVVVANRAKPMFSYTDYLSDWPSDLAAADVLIVDLQVNSQGYANHDSWDLSRELQELDAFLYQALTAAYEQGRHQGVLFVESFRVCAAEISDCNHHCQEAQQGFVDFNHTGSPLRYSWCNRWWTIATIERPVAQHYGLPIASYRDAVWPDVAAPSQLLPCFWNGLSHPDVVGHIMAGDVVAHALLRAVEAAEAFAAASRRSSNSNSSSSSNSNSSSNSSGNGSSTCGPLRPPTRYHQLLPARAYCGAAAGGGTRMTAERPGSFLPVVNTGCWALFADRPGKPGWICQRGLGTPPEHTRLSPPAPAPGPGERAQLSPATAAAGADALVFRVTFSSRPQLELTYLISYTHMGAARVTLLTRDGVAVDGASWTVDAANQREVLRPANHRAVPRQCGKGLGGTAACAPAARGRGCRRVPARGGAAAVRGGHHAEVQVARARVVLADAASGVRHMTCMLIDGWDVALRHCTEVQMECHVDAVVSGVGGAGLYMGVQLCGASLAPRACFVARCYVRMQDFEVLPAYCHALCCTCCTPAGTGARQPACCIAALLRGGSSPPISHHGFRPHISM